jgi:hypothetical protein
VKGEIIMTGICSREIEVIQATKENAWTEELRAHARQCTVCSATVGIMPMMKELLTVSTLESRAFPSYQVLWIRAQFTKRQEKLSLFDFVTFIGALVVGLVGLLGVLIWKIPGFIHFVPGFSDQSPPPWTELAPVVIPILVIVGGLLLYTIFSEVFAVE